MMLTASPIKRQLTCPDGCFVKRVRRDLAYAVPFCSRLGRSGLFVGSSSALNLVGAVRAAMALGPGHAIVTVLCDGGHRHKTRFWNGEFLSSVGLTIPAPGTELNGIMR